MSPNYCEVHGEFWHVLSLIDSMADQKRFGLACLAVTTLNCRQSIEAIEVEMKTAWTHMRIPQWCELWSVWTADQIMHIAKILIHQWSLKDLVGSCWLLCERHQSMDTTMKYFGIFHLHSRRLWPHLYKLQDGACLKKRSINSILPSAMSPPMIEYLNSAPSHLCFNHDLYPWPDGAQLIAIKVKIQTDNRRIAQIYLIYACWQGVLINSDIMMP